MAAGPGQLWVTLLFGTFLLSVQKQRSAEHNCNGQAVPSTVLLPLGPAPSHSCSCAKPENDTSGFAGGCFTPAAMGISYM